MVQQRIYEYAFKHETLDGKQLFKLPRDSGGKLIMDDEFRRTVEVNGLKGLRFNELLLLTFPYRGPS